MSSEIQTRSNAAHRLNNFDANFALYQSFYLSNTCWIQGHPRGDQSKEKQGTSLGLKSCKNGRYCTKGHWRAAEDAKLKELVYQFGPQKWNLIAQKIEGRSGKSCRLRWFNQLDPKLNKTSFTDEEEEQLLNAHKLHGNKWSIIARLFPGRTDNAVKNQWHVIMARRRREVLGAYMKNKRHCLSDSVFVDREPTIYPDAIGESTLACTNLSLSISSDKVHPSGSSSGGEDSSNGVFGETSGTYNSCCDRGRLLKMAMGMYDLTHLDSSFGLPGNESIITHNDKMSTPAENEQSENGEAKGVFIDFLGVGAT